MNRNNYEQISAAPRNDTVVAYKQFIRHKGWRVGGSVLCIIVNCWQPTDMKTQGEIPTQHYKSQTHSSSYPRYTGHRNSLMEIFIVLTSEAKWERWIHLPQSIHLHLCLHSLLLPSIRLISQFVFCWYTPYLFIFYIFCWCVPCFSWLLDMVPYWWSSISIFSLRVSNKNPPTPTCPCQSSIIYLFPFSSAVSLGFPVCSIFFFPLKYDVHDDSYWQTEEQA